MNLSMPRLRARGNLSACAAAVATLFPLLASAQNQLDSVIVTGTREAQPLHASVADVVLIDNPTLRDSGVDTVEDALRRFAGLQITRTGGPGQSSGYFMHGANSSGTVVLVDGMRVGSATLGQAEFESMSLAQIDRIEVLRGPASSLYGADAVAGVINIITRKGEGPASVTGKLAIGGYNSREASIGVSGAQGGFDYAANLSREQSDGVSSIRPGDRNGYYNPDDDGFKRTVGSIRLGFTPAEGHRIGISASQSKLNGQYDSTEAPTYSDPAPDFRNHLKTTVASIGYRGRLSDAWTTTFQLADNVDDSLSGGLLMNRYKTDRNQFTWQNAVRLDAGQQLVLAYERLREQVSGDAFDGKLSRTNNAFVLGYSGQFGPASLEASVRRDNNSAYGDNTTGNIGASYAFTRTLKIRALVGKTFRAPTFNDLYFPYYGISTIKPEDGRSAEIGLNWQDGNSSASATVYQNKIRNLIGYNPDPNGTDCPAGFFGCAGNTSKAKLQGATLTAAQRWGNLRVRGSVDFLDARDELTGVRLNRRAAHQESVSADYDAGAWTVGASVLDVGARPDSGVNLGAYALLDLRTSWRFKQQWRLDFKILNVADRDVQPVRDYQGLGRQAWIGLRYDTKGF
ncbi:TonB-dependent receptor [Pelomonas sp. HMWF004]|nr:TonB-dependent receptor [Pelomonas sp. HMWF004]